MSRQVTHNYIFNFVEGLLPLAGEAHCEYTSLHEYVIKILASKKNTFVFVHRKQLEDRYSIDKSKNFRNKEYGNKLFKYLSHTSPLYDAVNSP